MSSKQSIVSLLINKRAFELAGSRTFLNPDHITKSLELDAVTAHVMHILSPENQKLIFEIEELTSSRHAIGIEDAYKQGLYDGMQILKEIASFGGEGEMV